MNMGLKKQKHAIDKRRRIIKQLQDRNAEINYNLKSRRITYIDTTTKLAYGTAWRNERKGNLKRISLLKDSNAQQLYNIKKAKRK